MFTYLLTERELFDCYAYSRRVHGSTIKTSFRTGTNPRDNKKIFFNNMSGIMGEVAFSAMLRERYNLEEYPKMSIHELGTGDNGDFLINGVNIDVKTSKFGSKHLLVDIGDVLRKRSQQCESDFYVLALNHYREGKPTNKINVVGYIEKADLKYNRDFVKTIHAGSVIPNTTTKLLADNYAIHLKGLRRDFDELVELIKSGKKSIIKSAPVNK